MLHETRHTVLLIEADASLRRLIALGLQHRGMHVMEASSLANLPGMKTPGPSLVVLDIDGEAGSDHALLPVAEAHPYLSGLPMVVLAWEHLVPAGVHQESAQKQVTCLTKPFDARTLHATIDQILVSTQEIAVSQKQEVLAAARSSTTAPSIWPLITAVGLLLAFIGLMTQITISALGLLVVLVALLLWSLGKKPESEPWLIELG